MKRFIYLSLLLLLSFSLNAQAIYNVRISQEGERIVLLYDVAEDIFVSNIIMMIDFKQDVIPLEYLQGDINTKVLKGNDRVVVYNLLGHKGENFVANSVRFGVQYNVDNVVSIEGEEEDSVNSSSVVEANSIVNTTVLDINDKLEQEDIELKKDKNKAKGIFMFNLGYNTLFNQSNRLFYNTYTSFHDNSIGLMFGVHVKHCGWYMKGKTSLHFHDPSDYVYSVNSLYTGNTEVSYFSLSTGLTIRLGCPLYLYMGVGYGQFAWLYELENGKLYRNDDYYVKGVNGDVGFIGQIGKFSLSLGVSTINLRTVNIEAGIGFIF